MSGAYLVCNAGSSSLKLALYLAESLDCLHRQNIPLSAPEEAQPHLKNLIEKAQTDGHDILATGHRIVHGGQHFATSCLVTASVRQTLESLIPLAPLHQPPALAILDQSIALLPDTPAIACLDTAFHHTQPELNTLFALPRQLHQQGIRRYGFHGLSYASIARRLPDVLGEQANGRILAAHLGNGASVCALHNRQSLATSMGFSTLDGLMMGTRCGSLDAGVVLHLLKEHSLVEVEHLLYHESGLKGVSGLSHDMRTLLSSDHPHARQAVELYCLTAARHLASLLPVLGGADALIFTGGIGENAEEIREKIVARLGWSGIGPKISIHIMSAEEEREIAQDCKALS